MDIENGIFKKCRMNIDKLIEYGFLKEESNYRYEAFFMDDSFQAIIWITPAGKVIGKIIDLAFHEEYTSFRIKTQTSRFINQVREEYERILNDILVHCFEKEYFIYPQSNRITKIVQDKFGILPEFLWEKSPNHGVFRNPKNQKWFGIIMNIDKNKIVKEESGDTEVLNIKLDDEVSDYLRKKGIYEAYHMSKKNWVSILLDETLSDEEIMNLIEISYEKIQKR